MINNFRVSLLDLIWRYKPSYISKLDSDSSTQIELLDYGFKCEDGNSFADYDSVKIDDNGVIKVGSVKFFESYNQFRSWSDANPLSLRSLIMVIYCGTQASTRSSYSHLSVVNFNTPIEMMKCYTSLQYSKIECSRVLSDPEPAKRRSIYTRLFIDRLEDKSALLERKYKELNMNVNDLLIFSLFDSLMISTKNRAPMNELFTVIKGGSLLNNLTEQYQFEALLLGASGLLDSVQVCDEYLWKMRRTYSEIEQRFGVKSMNNYRWVSSSSSPRHTICVLLAHLASMLYTFRNLLFKVIDIRSVEDAKELFKVPLSDYWQQHNYLGVRSTHRSGAIEFPRTKQKTIIINSFVPFVFFYHKVVIDNESEDIADKLITLMENIEHESHRYTHMWSSEGVSNSSAFESQALTQLSKCHCERKACYGCPIGISLLLNSLSIISVR